MTSDKRRERRLTERIPCEVHLRKARIPAQIIDVSRHGIFVNMPDPPPVAHVVNITIQLPAGPFDVMATVQRRVVAHFDEQGAGFLLFAMGASARARWDQFVAGGMDPGMYLPTAPHAAAARPTGAKATYFVQPPDTPALLQFFDEKIVPLRTIYVTPPLKELGARVDVVLVHPDTDEETVFGATVVELNADRPGRMGMRFDAIDRNQRRSFLSKMGPMPGSGSLSMPDGRPLLETQKSQHRVTEYTFISPKLRVGQGADDLHEPTLEEVVIITDPAPDEMELVDKAELFDFEWDAEKLK